MRPIIVGVSGLTGASSTAARAAITATGAGPISLTLAGPVVSGGVATFDQPRRVLLTVAADEHTVTVTLIGTTFGGQAATETITLPSSTGGVASVIDYKTITSAVSSTGLSSTIAIGTTGSAGSPWVYFDPWANPVAAFAVVATGTVTYTVQESMDDPNDPVFPVTAANMTWFSAAGISSATATSQLSSFSAVPRYARVLIVSGATGTAGATGTFQQQGNVPK